MINYIQYVRMNMKDDRMKILEASLLLSRLLGGGLLGSWLLGGGLLCGGLLGSRLLCCNLLGSRLLGCLLSGRFLGSLLCGGLLSSLGLLLGLGSNRELEATSALLAGSTSSHNLLGSDHLLQRDPDVDLSLGGISDLVVGHDVLEDSLAGRTVPLLQGLDGGGDHAGEGWVGGGDLGLGGLLDLRGSNFLCDISHGEL